MFSKTTGMRGGVAMHMPMQRFGGGGEGRRGEEKGMEGGERDGEKIGGKDGEDGEREKIKKWRESRGEGKGKEKE